jgi:type II secretory pathway pseudopilin PulG
MITTTKKTMKYNRIAKQAGMTLIELTVVLLVLVGLAGLLVPYVSGFSEKTHDSTGAASISELNNTIQRYKTDKMTFPGGLENLIGKTAGLSTSTDTNCTDTAATANSVYCKMMNKTYLAPTLLNANHVSSLSMAGLGKVYYNNHRTTNATFASVDTTTGLTTLATTDYVATLTAGSYATIGEHLSYAFGGQPTKYNTTCNDYVVMGIGADNDMIGKAMQSSPVHFASEGTMGPINKYNRFVAVFEVASKTMGAADATHDPSCPHMASPAKFVGAAMVMGFPKLIGAAANQSWVWERQAAN